MTDAHLLLGRLDPSALTGVGGGCDMDRVSASFQGVAQALGLTIENAAAAAIRIADTHMAGAIRAVSLSRGHDPRDFVLFAFGGAGPLHAVGIARELGIPEVLVPARPGLTNALGCVVADLRQDFVQTVNTPLPTLDMDRVSSVLRTQRAEGERINALEKDEVVESVALHGADMQFQGQTHLIRVALPGPDVTREELRAIFEEAYFARFRVRLPEIRPVLVNLVTSVIGKRAPFPVTALVSPKPAGAANGRRKLYLGGGWRDAAVIDRDGMRAGDVVEGPAVIEQFDATTVVEPGATARVDASGNLRIAVGEARA